MAFSSVTCGPGGQGRVVLPGWQYHDSGLQGIMGSATNQNRGTFPKRNREGMGVRLKPEMFITVHSLTPQYPQKPIFPYSARKLPLSPFQHSAIITLPPIPGQRKRTQCRALGYTLSHI